MQRHTLFLLQGKDIQFDTVDRLAEWSERGLLHPVSFIDLGELASTSSIVDANHYVLRDGQRADPVPLLGWLADNFCDVLQLVSLHTATSAGEEREGVLVAERLRSGLEHWLGDRQKAVALACFLVDSNQASLSVGSALETWSANLVISPTDQAMPAGTTTPLFAASESGEANPAFADLAAQTLCTVGGAWRFLEVGPLDHMKTSSQRNGVQVLRTFVRSIDLEDPTDQVVGEALLRSPHGRLPGWPMPNATTPLVPAIPPQPFSSDAGRQLLERHSGIVDLKEFPKRQPTQPARLGSWAAFQMFFRYLIRRAKQAPAEGFDAAVTSASGAASSLMTRFVFGEASDYEVSVGRPPLRPTANLEDLQATVQSAMKLADPASSFMPPVTRDLWQEYMRVGLALVDGSPMPPTQTYPQIGDTRAVLTDPSDVVVSPDGPMITLQATSIDEEFDVVLRPEDPLQVQIYLDRLRDRLESLTGETSVKQDLEEFPEDDPEGQDNGDGESTDDSSASDGSLEHSEEHKEGALAAAREASRNKQAEVVGNDLGNLEKWVAGTREPFSWLVGESIGDALSESQRFLLEAAAELKDARSAEMPKSHLNPRSIWRPLAIGGGVFLLLGLLGLYGLLRPSEEYTTGSAVFWVVVAFLALLLGVYRAFRAFAKDTRERFQIIHRRQANLESLSDAAHAFRHYAQETLRLDSVYWQYRHWNQILRSVLHEPFVGDSPEPPLTDPVVITDQSRGTRSGFASPDPERLQSLTHDARRRIFTTGWALRCWEAGRTSVESQNLIQRLIDGRLDPYDDNIRLQSGVLASLSDGFVDGKHGDACRAEPSEITRLLILSRPLKNLASVVETDSGEIYPDAAAPSGMDRVDGLFQEIQPADEETRFSASLWESQGLTSPVGVNERIVSMPPGRAGQSDETTIFLDNKPFQHGGQLFFGAVRVDLSAPCAPGDLVLFDSDLPAVSAPPVEFEVDDEGD